MDKFSKLQICKKKKRERKKGMTKEKEKGTKERKKIQ